MAAKINYFEAAAILAENWAEIEKPGRFSKEQQRRLMDVMENPRIHQIISERVDDYLDELRLRRRARPVLNALKVMTLTPRIRAYLEQHDPKALAQAEAAIKAVEQE